MRAGPGQPFSVTTEHGTLLALGTACDTGKSAGVQGGLGLSEEQRNRQLLMLTVRRAGDRHHKHLQGLESWQTFDSRNGNDPLANGFGTLTTLKEGRLRPAAGVRRPRFDTEIITYVREGTLAYQDSMGRTGLIGAGEFQRTTLARGVSCSKTNASSAHWVHYFQISLRSQLEGLEPGHEQRRFSAGERRGRMCLVASPDSREGSLLIHQGTYFYSVLLDRGQHVVHELAEGRSAWLHVVDGEAACFGSTLGTGDGVGITQEVCVSVTANKPTELLLLDFGAECEVAPALSQSDAQAGLPTSV